MPSSLLKRTVPVTPGTRYLPNLFQCYTSSSAAAGVRPDDTDPEPDLVPSVVSTLLHRRSKSRWATLLSLYPRGYTPHQVSQILLQIRHNPRLALKFFQFTIDQSLSSHTLNSYSTMIHILARSRLKSHSQSLIKTAIRDFELLNTDGDLESCGKQKVGIFESLIKTYRVCDSAPFVFDLLIKAYLEMNLVDPCIEIVRMLKSRGYYAHVSTCNTLVSRVSKLRGCDVGYDLYKELFRVENAVKRRVGAGTGRAVLSPNVFTFNELMLSFYRNGFVDKVEQVWHEMGTWKCAPNEHSYNILMAAYCEEGEMEKAQKLGEEMKVCNLNPDVVFYNTLIGGYCKIGEIEKAEELYREMGLCGIESTSTTYQYLIDGYCKTGGIDLAMLLCKAMYAKGFRPDGKTIDAVVRGLCDRKSVLEAFALFKTAMEDTNFAARESSYRCLIKGLCEEGKMDEALKLQAHMVGKGIRPNSDIYNIFIHGYMKQGDLDMVDSLRKEMLQIEATNDESDVTGKISL